jgi:hypothetical protein
MARTALIIIDMLTTYDFEDAEKLIASVEEMLPQMAELRERALDEGAVTVYVNDSYGDWHSNRDAILERALEEEHARLVEPIAPSDDALFIFKARHSIFFQTPLEYLLGQEEVDRVVLVGQVTEQCILYSALDAYIRHRAARRGCLDPSPPGGGGARADGAQHARRDRRRLRGSVQPLSLSATLPTRPDGPFATSPVGSLGSPACSRRRCAISLISSGA